MRTNSNITVNPSTGTLTASNFSGNGSGLTSLSATNITGTLALARGGTGATSALGARNSLGLGTSNTPQFTRLGLGKLLIVILV